MRFWEWPATAEWCTAMLVDRMEVNIGPAWYGTPEAGLFVTYACTFMLVHLHARTHTVAATQSQVARLLTSSKGHNRAKARGATGTEHLIMSASAVFVTQTAGQCYWGPGRSIQCKPCNPTCLWCLHRKERWTDRISCRWGWIMWKNVDLGWMFGLLLSVWTEAGLPVVQLWYLVVKSWFDPI